MTNTKNRHPKAPGPRPNEAQRAKALALALSLARHGSLPLLRVDCADEVHLWLSDGHLRSWLDSRYGAELQGWLSLSGSEALQSDVPKFERDGELVHVTGDAATIVQVLAEFARVMKERQRFHVERECWDLIAHIAEEVRS